MKKPTPQDLINFALSLSLIFMLILSYIQAGHINKLGNDIKELQEINIMTVKILCKEVVDCKDTPWL